MTSRSIFVVSIPDNHEIWAILRVGANCVQIWALLRASFQEKWPKSRFLSLVIKMTVMTRKNLGNSRDWPLFRLGPSEHKKSRRRVSEN